MTTATECPYLHEKEIVTRLGTSMTDIDALNGTPEERKSKLCKLLMQHLHLIEFVAVHYRYYLYYQYL